MAITNETGVDAVSKAAASASTSSTTAKVASAATLAGFATSLFTGRFFLGFAAGVVIGAVGYKMVVDRKLKAGEISKTFVDLADTLETSDK